MPKTLKSVIDKLQGENKIPVNYISFRQAYLSNKVDETVTKYIKNVKKFTSTSYYIDESDIGDFSEALIKQFN